jgi:membrane-bound ClpP family serine protease
MQRRDTLITLGWLIAFIVIIVLALAAVAVYLTLRTYKQQTTTGSEELIGKTAEVREKLNPEGTVFYMGELWNAVSESGPISEGQAVIITKVEGLKLFVRKKE